MHWTYILLLLCLPDQTQETENSPKSSCQRIRRRVLLHHEITTLTYIKQMWKEIETQMDQRLIRNSTASMIFQSLERMSHGWCDPRFKCLSKEDKKERRSITTVLATIFAFGSLIIGPAIAAVLLEISRNTKWRIEELKKELGTTRLLADLEKRLNANARVEEVIASIFLHESIMSDLIHADNRELNRTWKKILKYQIKEYEERGFTKNTVEEVLGSAHDSLPKGTYKIEATVHKNKDCDKTRITIKAVGLIPDKSCLQLHSDQEKDGDYIRLLTNIKDVCVFAGKESTLLADNTTFITSNTIVGPCNNTDSFEFTTKENTLLVRPKSSRGYMATTCIKGRTRKITRKLLYRDQFYGLPLHCSTWISNEKKRTIDPKTDYLQSEEIFISATNGQEITTETTQPTMLFFAVEQVKDLDKKDDPFSFKETVDFLGSLSFLDPAQHEEMDKHKTRTLVVLACALVLVVALVVFWKTRKRFKAIPYLTIKYLRGQQNIEEGAAEERSTEAAEHEFVRLLSVNTEEEEEQKVRTSIKKEAGSTCKSTLHETDVKEGVLEKDTETKPARLRPLKLTNGQREKGAQYRAVTVYEETSNNEGAESTKTQKERKKETHYDVPRILFGTNMTHTQTDEKNKGTKTKETREHPYEGPKAPEGLTLVEYLDDVVLVRKTPHIPKKTLINESDQAAKKKMEGESQVDVGTIQEVCESKDKEAEEDDIKTEYEPKPEKNGNGEKQSETEKEKSTENIYETIAFNDGEAETNTNTDSNKYREEKDEDPNQVRLHDIMIKELHTQFLVMSKQHSLGSL